MLISSFRRTASLPTLCPSSTAQSPLPRSLTRSPRSTTPTPHPSPASPLSANSSNTFEYDHETTFTPYMQAPLPRIKPDANPHCYIEGPQLTHNMVAIAGTIKSMNHYFRELDKWEWKGERNEYRKQTVTEIKTWLMEGKTTVSLILSNLNLKDFPPLPDTVTSLYLTNNHLHDLPLLPSELTFLNVSNNALETLPSLPNKLQHLECGGNRLHHLPTLPPNLCKLFADHNHLVCLPNTLPATLTSLIISNNELTQLNNLPPQLDHLDAAFNRLRFLPPLPDTLKNLFVNHNRIFTAPESLPAQIKYISLAHNQLTHLPENILSLSSDSRIFLENNPLPRRALRHLAELVNAPDYQGPYIYFSMGNLNSDHTQPLHHAAAHWYPQKEQKHIRKTWQSFCNEAHAGEFSQFLDQLHDTVNVHNKPFRTSVNSWLAQLADDNVLRAHVFTIANDALGSCEDRITLTYNTMKKEGINLDVYRGKYDTQTNQLLLLAQQMFRLDALEKIAYEKITHLRFVDDVEVYLAYQTRLREPLQLAIDTPNMRFFDVAYVTQADLDAAYARVKQEEKTQFMPYLNLDWAPWQSVLQRCYPEEFSIAQEKISIMVDTQFSEKQTAYLQSQQLTDNEFHRITTAEQVRRDIAHEILSPLTHRLIHENRDPRDTLAIPPQAD